jgi:hypothetical protein
MKTKLIKRNLRTTLRNAFSNAQLCVSPHPQKEERGQSLVELAVSLVVLLLLLSGAVESSLALFQYVTIRDAAQEGALYASVNPPPVDPTDLTYTAKVDAINNRVIAAANDVVKLDASNIEIVIHGAACEGSSGVPPVPNSVEVIVRFNHVIIYPFVDSNTIALTAPVTSTILSPACP